MNRVFRITRITTFSVEIYRSTPEQALEDAKQLESVGAHTTKGDFVVLEIPNTRDGKVEPFGDFVIGSVSEDDYCSDKGEHRCRCNCGRPGCRDRVWRQGDHLSCAVCKVRGYP